MFTPFGGPFCLPPFVSPVCLPHLVVLCVYPVWWSILFTRLVVHCVYPIWWSIVFIPFGGPLCLPHLAIQQRLERRGLNAFAIQQRLERRACNHGRNCPPSKPTSGHSKLRKIYGSKSYHFSITLVLKNAIFGPSQSRALPGLRNITE